MLRALPLRNNYAAAGCGVAVMVGHIDVVKRKRCVKTNRSMSGPEY
jgi:hypothetical protein